MLAAAVIAAEGMFEVVNRDIDLVTHPLQDKMLTDDLPRNKKNTT